MGTELLKMLLNASGAFKYLGNFKYRITLYFKLFYIFKYEK